MNSRTMLIVVAAVVVALGAALFVQTQTLRTAKFVPCPNGGTADFVVSVDAQRAIHVDPDDGNGNAPSHKILRWSGPADTELNFKLEKKGNGAKPGPLPAKKKKPASGDLCYRVGSGSYTLKYDVAVPGSPKLDPRIIVN